MTDLPTPPWSAAAEASLLSAMMIDSQAVPEARSTVSELDFYTEAHRRIFRAIANLHDRGEATDVVTVGETLRATGELDASGGMEFLADLIDRVPNVSSVASHARIIRDLSRLRRLIQACRESIRDAMDRGGDAEAVLHQAEARILNATDASYRPAYRHVREGVQDALAMIARANASKDGVVGLRTGLPTLDGMLSGFEPGLLTVLAARPSMGKSALGWGCAESAARDGHGVAIASYEMSAGQLARRGLSKGAGISSHKIRRAYLDDGDYKEIALAAALLSELPIWIDEHPAQSVEALRADVRRQISKAPIDLVIVDYLQQMTGPGQNRNNEVEHISRGLKRMARDLGVHVLALAQLSRGVEHRRPPRPMLSDLRDSGAVEQDADTVLMLWRPEVYFDDKTPNEQRAKWQGRGELIVAKQRDGETGTIRLNWDGPTMTFSESQDIRGAT